MSCTVLAIAACEQASATKITHQHSSIRVSQQQPFMGGLKQEGRHQQRQCCYPCMYTCQRSVMPTYPQTDMQVKGREAHPSKACRLDTLKDLAGWLQKVIQRQTPRSGPCSGPLPGQSVGGTGTATPLSQSAGQHVGLSLCVTCCEELGVQTPSPCSHCCCRVVSCSGWPSQPASGKHTDLAGEHTGHGAATSQSSLGGPTGSHAMPCHGLSGQVTPDQNASPGWTCR